MKKRVGLIVEGTLSKTRGVDCYWFFVGSNNESKDNTLKLMHEYKLDKCFVVDYLRHMSAHKMSVAYEKDLKYTVGTQDRVYEP